MKKIEQKVITFINENDLVEKNDKILVALSGGPDSVFLLHFLAKYKRKYGIEIYVIHINHMIRGKEAAEDQEFCRKLSLSLSIKFYTFKKNVILFAKKNKLSVEEAGHILRYKEFDKILKISGCNKIATAHNSSDNAETVLLNLIKGAGLQGLSGIFAKRNNIIRPVLCLSKEEILSYLNFYKIDYRIDRTNLDNYYERSFLRNSIIPLIKEKLNPEFENSVLHTSEIFKDTNSFIEKSTENFFKDSYSFSKGELKISVYKLKQFEPEIEGYFFKSVLYKTFGLQITYSDYSNLRSLIKMESGKKVYISNNFRAYRDREFIVILHNKFFENINPVKIKIGETVRLSGRTLSIKAVSKTPERFSENKLTEFISAENIEDDFIVRTWRAGERFFPIGLKGSKKVSDFLTEQKISSLRKKEQLVLTNRDRIVWILGLRLDNRFKVLKNTQKAVKLCLK